MNHRRLARTLSIALCATIMAAAAFLTHQHLMRPKTITALFTSATGIYPGDEVRVSGVKVGSINAMRAEGTQVALVMTLARDVPLPADARAVIVAQNLISARYVQLVAPPASKAPILGDGAAIPLAHTAVPVEWDAVKAQLTRLATALGPSSGVSDTSVSRFIDSAASAMNGNGAKLRETIAQLSGAGRILANGSGDLPAIIGNLATFVDALRDSNTQIVQFENRLATLSSVVDASRSNLDAALTNLSQAVNDVQTFIAETRDKTSEQVQRLTAVTQNLVDHQRDLEQVLHVAPNALANTYNMMDPQLGSATGVFTFVNFAHPVEFICSMVGAVENVTATETGKLCNQYLGPALRSINFNNLPFPVNPFLAKTPPPEDLIYSEPQLMPGAAPPEPLPPRDLPGLLLPQDFPPAGPRADQQNGSAAPAMGTPAPNAAPATDGGR